MVPNRICINFGSGTVTAGMFRTGSTYLEKVWLVSLFRGVSDRSHDFYSAFRVRYFRAYYEWPFGILPRVLRPVPATLVRSCAPPVS